MGGAGGKLIHPLGTSGAKNDENKMTITASATADW